MSRHCLLPCLLVLLLIGGHGCAPAARLTPDKIHLDARNEPPTQASPPPPLVREPMPLPPWRPRKAQRRLTLTVNQQSLPELLLALAREAQLDLDLHPAVQGRATLHAVDQPLDRILERLARQHELRFEVGEDSLSVQPDSPYLMHYKVDYPNLARSTTAVAGTSSQIGPGSLAGGIVPGQPPLQAAANQSSHRIENSSRHQFWDSLERTLKEILREQDQPLPAGSSETVVEQQSSLQASGISLPRSPSGRGRAGGQTGTAATLQASTQSSGNTLLRHSTVREAGVVIVHAEAGVVAVRATRRQHDKVREFIERILQASRRQVLIEATVVEVALHDGYEQGIDWQRLTGGGLFEWLGNPLRTGVNLKYTRSDNQQDVLISLLASYGQTRVLSSPRLSVLNNQSALLKVVENYVYFSVKADAIATANVGTTTTYTTTPQTVPVGLMLTVTPQIGDDDQIILNIRPTITSIGREVPDPNPDLRRNGIENLVPVIRTREIESMMRLGNGQIAVLGGLMEDALDERQRRIPGLGDLPGLGEAFTNRQQQRRKTELVVLLRPRIVRDSLFDGSEGSWRPQDPGASREPAGDKP